MKKIDDVETRRLVLREIAKEDAKTIVSLRNQDDNYLFYKNPKKLTVEKHIQWYESTYCNSIDRIDMICIEKRTNMPVGLLNVEKTDKYCEFGILIDSNHQNIGYAKEAALALFDALRNIYTINKIMVKIHYRNVKSINFFEKIGFIFSENDGNFLVYKKEI